MHFYCLLPEHTVLYTSPVVIRNEKLLLAFVSGMLPFVELKEKKTPITECTLAGQDPLNGHVFSSHPILSDIII